MPSFLIQWTSHLKQIILNLDDIFTKKIEDLYKKKQFEQIKFEISTLEEKDKKNPFIYNLQGIIENLNKNFDQAKLYFKT